MKFIRPPPTPGAPVLISFDYIAPLEHQDADSLNYTAIILHNGREIEVTEPFDNLLQQSEASVKP